MTADPQLVWTAFGQRVSAYDATTGQPAKTFHVPRLAKYTYVQGIAADGDTVWVAVDRKLHDDPTPPDHVELIALDAATGHVRGRYPIPGAGNDTSDPQFIEGDGQTWIFLHGTMEPIIAGP